MLKSFSSFKNLPFIIPLNHIYEKGEIILPRGSKCAVLFFPQNLFSGLKNMAVHPHLPFKIISTVL